MKHLFVVVFVIAALVANGSSNLSLKQRRSYDITITCSNSTYYPAVFSISNSSGFYTSVTVQPHSTSNATVSSGAYYNVSAYVDYTPNPNDPNGTYSFWYYAGNQSYYGSSAYFLNVDFSSSQSISVN
ncbi:hypothetical protein [Niabella soli]|uniref:Uncharacterized protein n=1 Tax=Niabella soli DSM 19437 TaxID=929713 RepID=W0F9G4_9BACT|nr:hypothetical protein [Niabella soli]AHF18026.1 hypothetical protein NIASO_18950 [Niabella soli DSM 19437]